SSVTSGLILYLASGVTSKTRGMVWACMVQTPQEAPAQLATQSAQSGSCSAPTTRSPPSVGCSVVAVVPPALLLFLLLPHAAATSDNAMSTPANALMLFTSRTVSRPPCPVRGSGNQQTSQW